MVVTGGGLLLFLSGALKDLSQGNNVKSLEMFSISIFRTMRNGMSTGDSAVVEKIIHDAKNDIANLEVRKLAGKISKTALTLQKEIDAFKA